MKPGHFEWAENETFAAGPDIGSNARTEPPVVNKEDGLYRGYRPAADILNYQFHRAAKIQEFVSRMKVMTIAPKDSDLGSSYYKNWSICHGLDDGSNGVVNGLKGHFSFHFSQDSAAVTDITETQCDDTGIIRQTGVLASAGAGTLAGITNVDSDHENNKSDHHRIVAIHGTSNDQVYYATALGTPVYALVTFTGGTTGLDWKAVACDQTNSEWLIGSAASGGSSYVRLSTNGTSFTESAGWGGINENVLFIGHSNHQAGDLGPDDPGNPHWLVVTTSYSFSSADGITWTAGALHGAGVVADSNSIAYSKTAGRWFWPIPLTGDVKYTDDNGTTPWSTFSGATGSFYNWKSCTSDGYGLVLASGNAAESFLCSVNDGTDWFTFSPEAPTTIAAGSPQHFVVHCVFDKTSKAYEQPKCDEYFVGSLTDTGLNDFEYWRSLRS